MDLDPRSEWTCKSTNEIAGFPVGVSVGPCGSTSVRGWLVGLPKRTTRRLTIDPCPSLPSLVRMRDLMPIFVNKRVQK